MWNFKFAQNSRGYRNCKNIISLFLWNPAEQVFKKLNEPKTNLPFDIKLDQVFTWKIGLSGAMLISETKYRNKYHLEFTKIHEKKIKVGFKGPEGLSRLTNWHSAGRILLVIAHAHARVHILGVVA